MHRALSLLIVGFLLAGCGSGSDKQASAQPTPCPSVVPLRERSALPDDISLSSYGTIISQEVKSGFLISEARSDLLVIEADPMIQRDLLEHGFEILSHDNEGFEAEIFFARGETYVGTFSLHDLCEGQIRIKLVLGADRYGKSSP